MKANFTKLLVLVFLFAGSISKVAAQAAKFGKVSEEELKMTSYAKDSTADAVILSDYGFSRFDFTGDLQVVTERHIRIKIFKKSAYSWADVVVPYFENGSTKEKVIAIKGYTFNLEGGKEVKHKLDRSSVFDEKVSEYKYLKKFTMPNVKEGSVIDVSYTVASEFVYNLNDWSFQSSIPTMWSEYRAQIPEYFDYKFMMQGYNSLYQNDNTRQAASGSAAAIPDMVNNSYVWIMKDVPALKEEKYITTVDDYRSKIQFELQRVHFPGQGSKTMTGDWESVTKDLLIRDHFGMQLNRSGFFKEELAAIQSKYKTPEEQVAAIHDLVKTRMKWNQYYGYYTESTIRKAWMERTGNIADINLLLTAMLLEAGFDAAPVILSTRDHGRVNIALAPMLSKFNYVVAHVKVGDKEVLLDASDPLVTPGMLPGRCLNGQGRLIKKNDQRWVNLAPVSNSSKLFSADLKMNGSGEIVGTGRESAGGYRAVSMRREILQTGENKYKEELVKEIGDFALSNTKIISLNDLNSALDITYDIKINGSGRNNDIIYLNPMLGRGEDENPFKLNERLYPVDFATPIDDTYMCKLAIPEGYVVEEAPKSIAVNLPDNGGRFMYMVQQEGNTIQVMSKVNINKPIFYAQEYAYLKEFFNQIIAKHAEQIVLKKIAAN